MNGERKGLSGCISAHPSQHPKREYASETRTSAVRASQSLKESFLSPKTTMSWWRDTMMIRVRVRAIIRERKKKWSFPSSFSVDRHLYIGVVLSIWHIRNQRQKQARRCANTETCFERWDASLWWFECTVNAPTSHLGSWGVLGWGRGQDVSSQASNG